MAVAILNHVAILEWPADAAQREAMRGRGVALLWLVSEQDQPPAALSQLEDWARAGTDAGEIHNRVQQLSARIEHERRSHPELSENGVLHVGDRWVVPTELEARLLELCIHTIPGRGSVLSALITDHPGGEQAG